MIDTAITILGLGEFVALAVYRFRRVGSIDDRSHFKPSVQAGDQNILAPPVMQIGEDA